jgi:GTP-binding protein HflX
MNRLTAAGVLVQDQLFATLDPTVRRLRLPGGLPALLVDTVGFIHKLPHQLVEAFKSTLEQVGQADVLVHVVDVSHSAWREHVQVVEAVLGEIGAGDRPAVFAFNKIDRLADDAQLPLVGRDGELVSARSGAGIERLLERIGACVERHLTRVDCVLTTADGEALSLIRRAGRVLSEEYVDGTAHVSALVPSGVAGRLRRYSGKGAATRC